MYEKIRRQYKVEIFTGDKFKVIETALRCNKCDGGAIHKRIGRICYENIRSVFRGSKNYVISTSGQSQSSRARYLNSYSQRTTVKKCVRKAINLPTMIPIRVLRFFQAHDINVPVVSFKIAHGSMVLSYKAKLQPRMA